MTGDTKHEAGATTARGGTAGALDGVIGKAQDAAASARDTVSDAIGSAGAKLGDAYGVTRDTASAALHGAADQAGSIYGAARDQSVATVAVVRDRASQAKEKTSQSIDENPLAAIIGGIAVGAMLGALLPSSQRETDLLAPAGGRIKGAARDAIGAAKAAGLAKLDELGLSREAATGALDKILAAAGDTARSAGSAAAGSIRDSQG